ncbi:piggyBac transposable element-derived protein 4-like [Engraulis encrasicolus]|uniref:piggyBac transposable element-derived protein 4-like n=1 Tax=Engraulis encrasicolus TaxID=184585 RepID=UPI002FD00A58
MDGRGRKRYTLAEIHAQLFDDGGNETEDDAVSEADSTDSALQAFEDGIDVVLDFEETSDSDDGNTSDDPLEGTSTAPHPAASPTPPAASPTPPAASSVRMSGRRRDLHPAPTPCPPPVSRGARRGKRPSKASAPTPCPPPPSRGATSGKRTSQAPASTPSRPAKRASLGPPPQDSDFWRDATSEDVEPPPLPFRPRRPPGPQLDPQVDYRPLDLFLLFFSKDVVRTLCRHTNLHAAKRAAQGRKRKWVDIEPEEMYRFIGLVIYKGLMKLPEMRDGWRKDRLHSFPFPASVMPGYRYEVIFSTLHMSDPAVDAANDQLKGQPGHDGLCRLRPLHDDLLTACRAYFHPLQNLSVDERMVGTKSRIGMKMYSKDKPTKWGFKLFVLADSSNGYTWHFSIYEGKARAPSVQGLSFGAVVELFHDPSLGTGYSVYVDNFYTSSELFLHRHGMNCGTCGTIRENRIGFPRTQWNAMPKNAARGELRWIRDGPLLFVKWRDSRDVTMCSTIHKAYGGQTVKRRVKDRNTAAWSIREVPVPEPVKAYNKFMGGVDLSDALIKYYTVTHKTRRWYMKLFLHFVDIAVVNSFILHKETALAQGETPLTQKSFREFLCLELADFGKPQPDPPAETSSADVSAEATGETPQAQAMSSCQCLPVPVVDQLSSDPHLKATQGRRKCVLCGMKTMFKCKACQVALCIIVDRLCFTTWHEQKSTH